MCGWQVKLCDLDITVSLSISERCSNGRYASFRLLFYYSFTPAYFNRHNTIDDNDTVFIVTAAGTTVASAAILVSYVFSCLKYSLVLIVAVKSAYGNCNVL